MGLNVQSVLLDEAFFALRIAPDEPIRLFDILDDPGCKRDLSRKHPERVERARALFSSEHAENPWYVELTDALRKGV